MKNKLTAEIALLFVAFIWGATFVIVQNAIDELPPLFFNAIRFFLAGLIIYIILLFIRKEKTKFQWSSLIPGILLGCCLFIGYAFQTIGLLYTTPAKAGFITGLSVVMVPFLAFVFTRNHPRTSAIFGSIAAATGLYLLAVKNTTPLSIGDFYVFLCTFGFAFHIILTDRFAKRIPVILLTTIQIFTVALLCATFSIFMEDWTQIFNKSVNFSNEIIFAILITSLLGTAAAFFIQTQSQKATSPTRVAIILAMEPVFAAITSYFWINERLNIEGVIGCVLIFTGMIISEVPFGTLFKVRLKKNHAYTKTR
ncbi:membrane protein [Heyndrickxia sporothermodurans]|nr:membrane protein [Heyndrickxia sporothermodurans]